MVVDIQNVSKCDTTIIYSCTVGKNILLVILINDESDVSMTPPLSPALFVVKPTAGDINKLISDESDVSMTPPLSPELLLIKLLLVIIMMNHIC